MQKRFESEPQFQATLLLLQERIPKVTTFYSPYHDVADTAVLQPKIPQYARDQYT